MVLQARGVLVDDVLDSEIEDPQSGGNEMIWRTLDRIVESVEQALRLRSSEPGPLLRRVLRKWLGMVKDCCQVPPALSGTESDDTSLQETYPQFFYFLLQHLEIRTGIDLHMPTPDLPSQEIPTHLPLIGVVILQRRFAVTSKGSMGLIPATARKGDKVCVLDGGISPYILRQEGDHWTFIGECYIHGLHEENLLRSLPVQTFHIH